MIEFNWHGVVLWSGIAVLLIVFYATLLVIGSV